jgi:hypothetical protein
MQIFVFTLVDSDGKIFRICYPESEVFFHTSLAVMVRMRSKSSTSSPNVGLSFGW